MKQTIINVCNQWINNWSTGIDRDSEVNKTVVEVLNSLIQTIHNLSNDEPVEDKELDEVYEIINNQINGFGKKGITWAQGHMIGKVIRRLQANGQHKETWHESDCALYTESYEGKECNCGYGQELINADDVKYRIERAMKIFHNAYEEWECNKASEFVDNVDPSFSLLDWIYDGIEKLESQGNKK